MCRLGGTAARASSNCRSIEVLGAAVAASSSGVAPARVDDTLGEAWLERSRVSFRRKNDMSFDFLILGAKN